MSDTLTARQERILDAVEESPARAEADDVEILVKLAHHRSEEVRIDAAQVLSLVAAKQPGLVTDRIDSVLQVFQISDVNVRAFTLETVATLGQHSPDRIAETTAITNVAQALNDRNDWIRTSAAEALGDIGSESPELLEDTEVIPMLVRRMGSEEFSDARAQMARALGRIAQTAPRMINESDKTEIERLLGEDDEIEESLRFAVDAIAEARTSSDARGANSSGETAAVFCPECGRKITDENVPNFCQSCGQELP